MEKKQIRADTFDIKQLAEHLLPGYKNSRLTHSKGGIEYFPMAVIVTDEEGLPISYNKAAENLLGEISPHLHPDDWPTQFGLYLQDGNTPYQKENFPLRYALQGENVETEVVFLVNSLSPEGKWVTMIMVPLLSQNGEIKGALVLFSDISDQKEEEILREKQARFAEASYALSQQIARIGNDPSQILNSVVLSASETVGDGCVAELLNPTKDGVKIITSHHNKPHFQASLHNAVFPNEFKMEGMIKIAVHSGKPRLELNVDEVRLKENALPEQIRYIDEIGIQSMLLVPIKGRDGVLGTLSLFRDRNGAPYTPEDQTFIMDIAYRAGLAIDNSSLVNSLRVESSVRRRTERALEFSEVRFQSIFTSTSLGIKLLDLDGTVLETNPAFQNILEYTEDELRGKPIAEFWHPEDAKLLIQLLDKLKKDRVQSFQLEHRLLNKSGEIVWFNVTFTGIKGSEHDNALAFIVAIAENITDRKRMEAEMTEMKSRLNSHIEMERLQLAQELHDGPLQDLYSAIYKTENWGMEISQENKEKVEVLKQDLLQVVKALRNTAKNLRPPAITNFGLEKAIRSHAEEFCIDHPEINVHLNLAQDKKALPEDIRLVLFRIYQHSMANVVRHSRATEVHVRFAFDAEEAQLTIKDNGIGFKVPKSWVALVRQGHFGLAGAVERVSLLGGTFVIDSYPGVGTTAQVIIPIKESDDGLLLMEEK